MEDLDITDIYLLISQCLDLDVSNTIGLVMHLGIMSTPCH